MRKAFFAGIFGAAIFSGCSFVNTKVVPLWSDWDDATSWDPAAKADWPNPSSNPSSELLVGDSRTYYKMPDLRTYFRFTVDLPKNSEILSAKILFHCSYGGKTKPKLKIHYVDAHKVFFSHEPWKLPLSAVFVSWEKERHEWNWKTHKKYETPDLRVLLEDWRKKYGGFGDFGAVIINVPDNQDNFKGISSFDDEPQRSAKLVIKYQLNK